MRPTEYNHSCIPVNHSACLTDNQHICSFGFMKYGERLKKARAFAGITQTDLAEKIFVSQQNISQLENGDATGSEFTAQIADVLGVSPLWLACEKGDMLEGKVVYDQKLRRALDLMEPLPDYALDHVIKEIAETAQLLKHATEITEPKKKGNGTQ